MVSREAPKDEFYTMLAPGTKKIAICERRVGTRDRMVQIALCTSEAIADKIVKGLHLYQKEVVKIDRPIERELEAARQALKSANDRNMELAGKFRTEEIKARDLQRQLDRVTSERNVAQAKLGSGTFTPA